MCKVMDELRKEAADEATFIAKLESLVQIMDNFNVTVQEALKVLQIPESEHERYIAAIQS